MVESIVLGAAQGIFEWLPISSEGIILLLKTSLFKSNLSLAGLINYALFLHLGTLLAVLIYFRKEAAVLFTSLLDYKKTDKKKVINFYVLATIVSGIVGLVILKLLDYFGNEFSLGGKGIALLVGFALLATAFMQFKKKAGSYKTEKDLKIADGFILGVLQGLSIIPGLSRSGLTVSGLLLRKFNDTTALKLSFIMSLPIVLAGNIILNLDKFAFSLENLIGLVFSFLFGIITIHVLLKVSERINFAWFALAFGLIVIISAFASGGEIKEEQDARLSLQAIIGEESSIIGMIDIDVDGDGKKETAVLYVLNGDMKKSEGIVCDNIRGEMIEGNFYFGVADGNKLKSRIELLADSFDRQGIVAPQDLNGDGKSLEFIFKTYAGCELDYVEVIGWSRNKEELIHYDFYKNGEILQELPVSSGLRYEEGLLIQEYRSDAESIIDYYSFSEEGERFDFVNTARVPD